MGHAYFPGFRESRYFTHYKVRGIAATITNTTLRSIRTASTISAVNTREINTPEKKFQP